MQKKLFGNLLLVAHPCSFDLEMLGDWTICDGFNSGDPENPENMAFDDELFFGGKALG